MDKTLMASPEELEARVAALEVLVLALLYRTSRAHNLQATDFATVVGAEPPQCQPLLELPVANQLGRALVRLNTLLQLEANKAELVLGCRAQLRALEKPEQRQAFDEFFLDATDDERADLLLEAIKKTLAAGGRKKPGKQNPQ